MVHNGKKNSRDIDVFFKAPLVFDRGETTVQENDESWKLLWHNVAENGSAVQWDRAIVR